MNNINDDEIFVNEDISKPENRLNLALFHLQMDDEFHIWFCENLGLPISAVIYPRKNLSGHRPDFIVKNDNQVMGCIEVELGNEDKSQMDSYRSNYDKVFSITGKNIHNSNLSLEKISSFLSEKLHSIENQQKALSVKYLIKLITIYSNENISYSRNPVSEEVLHRPFVKKLLDALQNYKPHESQNKIESGKYYCDTNAPEGFSFRVFTPTAKDKSTSLLSITKGRDHITFLSEKWYRNYLNHKPESDVTNWINFITETLSLPINHIKLKGKLEVPITTVEKNFEGLVRVITRLI